MSANSRPLVATIYNPHNQSKEALIAGFTARKASFDRLFRDIREAPMTKPEQHYLVQGVRGMGKTTFLLRLAYEVQNTPELAERLIPIVFNEEEYGISSLADFWERTARYLEEADPTFAGLEDQIKAQYGGDDYERAALGTLLGTLRQHNKKLLLLIDNIGDLFRKFDELENKRLREVLLTAPELRLIGATPTLIEQTHDYSKPYFDFFRVIQLGGLNQEETKELFLKLGEAYGTDAARELVEKRPGRIEALRRLTGGVIRTMVLLFEIMVENNTGSVFRDLNALIDRVTPLYKHRIDDLPTQQQKIVAALANAWDAANTKELAQAVRLESKVVSAQLKQLINNGIVEKVETNTKNHLYRLEERFFNIWYLMRFGRKTDERVLWLIRFFELMFDGDEEWLQEKIENLLKSIKSREITPEAALYLTTAYSALLHNEDVEHNLKNNARIYLTEKDSSLLLSLQPSKLDVIEKCIINNDYDQALSYITSLNSMSLERLVDTFTLYLVDVKLDKALNIFDYKFRDYVSSVDIDTIIDRDDFDTNKFMCVVTAIQINETKDKLIKNYSNSEDTFKKSISLFYYKVFTYYFLTKQKNRQLLCTKLMNFAFAFKSSPSLEEYLCENSILLWNGVYPDPEKLFYPGVGELFSEITNHSKAPELHKKNHASNIQKAVLEMHFEFYLKLLLAKKQYHTTYKYFQQEEWQLKDRFKPLYYATMYFLQDEYPTEYLRMGPELAETVQDILKEVDQMTIDYA
ncbi:hypothetical protein [uncultured Fibrella sp.]|uniref:hypothetical protein n=1 Tax=uncultured Fibrella sp. TaxID=1284596 RepID=UPI0035CBF26A